MLIETIEEDLLKFTKCKSKSLHEFDKEYGAVKDSELELERSKSLHCTFIIVALNTVRVLSFERRANIDGRGLCACPDAPPGIKSAQIHRQQSSIRKQVCFLPAKARARLQRYPNEAARLVSVLHT